VDKVITYYQANARPHQRLGSLIEKMGFEQFSVAVLGK
jgi:dissimilatory sulfite reductase (desulfoviridin) alpha/beta subunit